MENDVSSTDHVEEINQSEEEKEIQDLENKMKQLSAQLEEKKRQQRLKTEEALAQRTQREQSTTDTGNLTSSAPNTVTNAALVGDAVAAPFAQRSASEENTSSSMLGYTKLEGSATDAGASFELKNVVIIFMRAINENLDFHLATNMKAAGLFDDIVFKCRPAGGDGEWIATLIQLKHKIKSNIYLGNLLSGSKKNDFGLKKYYESNLDIKRSHGIQVKDLIFFGEFDKFNFVLFTNAKAGEDMDENIVEVKEFSEHDNQKLKTKNSESVEERSRDVVEKTAILDFESLMPCLSTSSTAKIISFKDINLKTMNSESKKRLQNVFGDLTALDLTHFLRKLKIFTNQANEDKLDNLIKKEIMRYFRKEKGTEHLVKKMYDEVKAWFRSGNYLTENAKFWKSIKIDWIKNLSSLKQDEMLFYDMTFRPGACDVIREVLPNAGVLNIVVSGKSTSLSALKVHQYLSSLPDNYFIFVGLQALLQDQEAVLWAWQHQWCRTLVVESEPNDTTEELQVLTIKLEKKIHDDPRLLLVLVTAKEDRLVGCVKSNFKKYDDVCSWIDLSEISQTSLLDKEVDFQGHQVQLKCLVGVEGRLTEQLKISEKLEGDTLNTLLQDKFTFGLDLESRIPYYIPRTLKGSEGVVDTDNLFSMREKVFTSLFDNNNLISMLSNDSERVVDINSHSQVKNKTVLLVAEPGMGKSTLLTHLVQKAKVTDPSRWIVRINLLNCTTYLRDMKIKEFNLTSMVEFMKQFCLRKESCSTLEEEVFEYCLKVSGKIVVFIDAFDEICSTYREKVHSLICNLLDTKIESLWVSSRLSEKHGLELAMNVKSYSLEPFTEQDQRNFLRLFWKDRFSITEDTHVAKFTNIVIKLAEDSFKGGNLSISIPQLTMLLAEYFEDDLVNWQDTDAPKKIVSLDIFRLYEHFVQKKFDHYVCEKKQENLSNPAVISDNEEICKNFIENHKTAALMLLFSTNDLSYLTHKGVFGYRTDDFLSKINRSVEKTGIIDTIVNGKPHFIHRTFAEYFAALWFAEKYPKFREFLKSVLFSEGFAVVKEMFDLALSRGLELHTAVVNADLESVKSLLSSGADVNQTDAGGRTALHLISGYGKTRIHETITQIAQTLLDHKASLVIVDGVMQWQPLQYADYTSSWTVAGLMLLREEEVGIMIETKLTIHSPEVFNLFIDFIKSGTKRSLALMHSASAHGHLGVVRYLVEEFGADVNCLDSNGATCMHKSAQGGHKDILEYLGKKGASHIATDNKKYTPILYATEYNHVDILDYLLQKGAGRPFNKVSEMLPEERNIFLLLSVYQRNMSLTIKLINNNAFVSYANKQGTTPLHWAVHQNDMDMVNFLLGEDVNINAKDKNEKTPLSEAVSKTLYVSDFSGYEEKNQLEIVRLLLNNGATFRPILSHFPNYYKELSVLVRGVKECEIEFSGEAKASLLHFAIHCRNLHLVNYVLQDWTEIDIKCSSNRNVTPLMHAALRGSFEIIESLIKKGADVNATDVDGNTPSHYAVMYGYLKTIQDLLSNSNINARNSSGETPLALAVATKRHDIVKYLTERGADTAAANEDEVDALQTV